MLLMLHMDIIGRIIPTPIISGRRYASLDLVVDSMTETPSTRIREQEEFSFVILIL